MTKSEILFDLKKLKEKYFDYKSEYETSGYIDAFDTIISEFSHYEGNNFKNYILQLIEEYRNVQLDPNADDYDDLYDEEYDEALIDLENYIEEEL